MKSFFLIVALLSALVVTEPELPETEHPCADNMLRYPALGLMLTHPVLPAKTDWFCGYTDPFAPARAMIE